MNRRSIKTALTILGFALTFHPVLDAQRAPDSRARLSSKLIQRYALDKIGTRTVAHGFNVFSMDDEMEMGAEIQDEIESSVQLVNDEPLLNYVRQVGAKIVLASDIPDRKFTFKVIRDPQVNAEALPNGTVYVTTGLLLSCESESELAAVLGHEIAHVAARHAGKQSTRRGLMGAANLALGMFGGGIGAAVQPVTGMAQQLSVLRFSRGDEREADVLGLEYQYRAGYDPSAFVRLLQRLADVNRTKPGLLARMYASHPEDRQRLQWAQQVIQQILPARDESIDDTSDFAEMQQGVANLIGLHDPRFDGRPHLLVKRNAEPEIEANHD